MHDWMFEPGPDPLSLTLAEQPGPPDPGAADWFSHGPADDFETWLFETQPKGDFEDFGPMFVEGEGEGGGDDDGAVELGEVVVTGTRMERLPTAVQIEIGDRGEVGEIGDGGGGGFGPPMDYEPPVSHDGNPDSIAAAEILAAAITSVDDAIDNLPDNAVIQMPDGSTMTGAQIKALWNSMSFHITTGSSYGVGRGGANHDGLVTLSSGTVNGYFAHGENGMNFLLLHEIAHNTAFARISYNALWSNHLAAGGTASNFQPGTTGYFEQNEVVANNIARILGVFTGVTIPAWGGGFPTHGY